MRHALRLAGFFLAGAALAGCASHGFDRGALRSSIGTGAPAIVDDAEIGAALERKPQLPKPFRLGVFFREAGETGYRSEARSWRWNEADKEGVLALANRLKEAGEVSEAFLISPAVVEGTDVRALRLAAARQGADALLVVSGAQDFESYENPWSLTYLALAPLLFAPGSELETIFISRATMWDVRNEFLYAAVEAEGLAHQTRAFAFLDRREAAAQARGESLARLRKDLGQMIEKIAGLPRAPAGAVASEETAPEPPSSKQ